MSEIELCEYSNSRSERGSLCFEDQVKNERMNETINIHSYCKKMIDLLDIIKNKLFKQVNRVPSCMVCDCIKPPLYNYMNTMLPLYCEEHRYEEMIVIEPPTIYIRGIENEYVCIQPSDYESISS